MPPTQRSPVVLSPSRVETYRECPARFRYQFVDRAQGRRGPSPHLAFDRIVHDTLRYFFVTQRPNEPWQIERLEEGLRRHFDDRSFASPAEASQFRDVATRGLAAWFAANAPTPREPIDIDYLIKTDLLGSRFTGKIDRVDRLPNGKLEIVDYKSGTPATGRLELESSLAVGLLWLAADTLWPGQIESIRFDYLRDGSSMVMRPQTRHLDAARAILLTSRDAIAAGRFEPTRNQGCVFCDFQHLCPIGRKPLVSWTQVSTFLGCARKFHYRYVSRTPVSEGEKPNFVLARVLRETLGAYVEHGRFEPDDRALRALRVRWPSGIFADPEEEQRFREMAESALLTFNKQLDGRMPTSEALGLFAHGDFADTTVHATFDRIDALTDGRLEIIEYKTTARIPGAQSLAEDPTGVAHFLIAEQMWPGRVARVTWHYLLTGDRVHFAPDPAEQERVRQILEKAVGGMAAGEQTGTRSALCAWCGYYDQCPDWPAKPHALAGESRDIFKQRLRLSYSKMSSFENCPRAWKKVYIDKVPPQPRPFFSFGTAIHEAFEEIYAPARTAGPPLLDELLAAFDRARQRHRVGYANAQIEEQYRQDGVRQLTTYYHRYIAGQPFAPAHAVEEYFEIPLGRFAVMTGSIDRIDRLADGTFAIRDYKTEPTLRSQDEVDHDKQLTIYYYACETALNLRISNLSLFMMEHDVLLETTRGPDHLTTLVEHVDRVAQAITTETAFAPRKNKYCRSCDHLADCPLRAEIEADPTLVSMQKF